MVRVPETGFSFWNTKNQLCQEFFPLILLFLAGFAYTQNSNSGTRSITNKRHLKAIPHLVFPSG